MARMHSRRHGKSSSKKPAVKVIPEWFKMTKSEVEGKVIELAKEGHSASMIGRVLKDKHGVPSVKLVCGRSVMQILNEAKLVPELPEDMTNLIKNVITLRKHLERNERDLHNRRRLELAEAKIKRLVKYYKARKVLPASWYYKPEEAALMVK